jgi:hypothetical protein
MQSGAGINAPLFYTADGQVNIQIPWELQGQSSGDRSSRAQQRSRSHANRATCSLFARYFTTNNQPIIVDSSGNLLGTSNPTTAGSVIQIYCTGLGPVAGPPRPGTPRPAPPQLLLVRASSSEECGHRTVVGPCAGDRGRVSDQSPSPGRHRFGISGLAGLKYGRIRIESGDNPREVNTKGLGILENLFSGKASTRGMNVVIKHYRLLPKTR